MSMLERFSKGERPPVLFRSQSARRRFLGTKTLWFSVLTVFAGLAWDIVLLSEPPAIVEWAVKIGAKKPSNLLIVGFLLNVCVIVSLLWILWHKRTREIRTQAALRDFSQTMAESIRDIRHLQLDALCQNCCNAAVKVFEPRVPRQGIGCATRIRGNTGFETNARAGRLSASRSRSTTPVSFTSALAQLLESDDAQRSSVILIPDIDAAYSSQQLERDENTDREEFAGEVKSMMIARLISIDSEGEAELAGIFYITSDKANGLGEELIDLMVTVSTMVSEVVREKLDVTNLSDTQFKQLKQTVDEHLAAMAGPKTIRGEKSGSRKRGKKGSR